MSLYERIVALAAEKGVSLRQAELAMSMSNGTLGSWRRKVPKYTTLQRVADYFDVSVDYLLGNKETKERERAVRVPVYASIPAGIPLEAIQEVVDYEEISEDLALRGEYFGIRVDGDSMEPELRTGDVLIVRCQPEAENGDIVVAGVNGDEATVKRLVVTEDVTMLQPLNPAYAPIVGKPIHIYGRVVEVKRRL